MNPTTTPQGSTINSKPILPNYGSTFYSPTTGQAQGINLYNPITGAPLTPTQNANPGATPIPFDTTSQQTTPAVTPPATTPTATAGLQGTIDAHTTQMQNQAKQNYQTQQDNLKQSGKDYIQNILDIGNASKGIDHTAENNAAKLVDTYTSQLEQEQLANRHQQEAIMNDPNMATSGQAAAMAEAINRQSLSKQADIAILQSAANRDYTRAATIAQQQLTAKLEPLKAQLDARKFIYDQNKDLFDKADAQKIKEEDRQYNDLKDNLTKISDLKLTLAKNGANASVLNGLDSYSSLGEALNDPKITQYFTSPADKLDLQLKRLQIAKAGQDLSAAKGTNLNTAISPDQAIKLGIPIGTTYAQYNALQGKPAPLSAVGQKALDTAKKLKEMMYQKNFIAPIGGGRGLVIPGSKRADFNAAFQTLSSQLSLDNVKLLKGQGAVSDAERALLAAASSKLNKNTSSEYFSQGLDEVINDLQGGNPDYQYATAAANLATTNANNPSNNADAYANSLMK